MNKNDERVLFVNGGKRYYSLYLNYLCIVFQQRGITEKNTEENGYLRRQVEVKY